VQIFADIGCHVGSARDPYGRILGFIHRNRYIFLQGFGSLSVSNDTESQTVESIDWAVFLEAVATANRGP
jgi:hypothetical protein